MVRKPKPWFVVVGLASVLICSNGEAVAQCNGGGGSGGAMPSGSTSALLSSVPYVSSPLAMNYPSSVGLIAQQYQQRALQAYNQANAMAYQNAMQQRMAMMARQQQALPYRLARAEANRLARAQRAAQRIAQRDSGSEQRDDGFDSRGSYTFASVTSD